MRMFGKILYNVAAASINIVAGLLRNKIFATFLSLSLFGILSISQQSASLLFTLFAFGLPLGITTLSSQLLTKDTEEQNTTISRIVVLTVEVGTVCLAVLGVAVLINPSAISLLITGRTDYALPVAVLLLATPFMVIENCLFAIMEGMGKLKEIVSFKIIPAVVTLPILYVLCANYSLVGAAIGLVINELTLVAIGLFLLRGLIVINRSVLQVKGVFVQVFRVAALSFGVGTAWFAADFIVKRYMLEVLGETNNGIIQSVAKITDLYPNIALSWLSMHLFPIIAVNISDKALTTRALQRTVLVALSLIVPIVLLLFAFRSLVLDIVYRKEFTVAVDYFGAMLTIGIPKVFSWVIGLALLPVGLKKQWFYSAIILTCVYACSVWLAMGLGASLYSIPLAYGAGLLLQTLYTIVVYRRRGIVFEKLFTMQVLIFVLIACLLGGAVFWTPFLFAAILVYLWFIYHYKFIHEIREKVYDFGNKGAA